jgi:carboxymethylenebutenolidase
MGRSGAECVLLINSCQGGAATLQTGGMDFYKAPPNGTPKAVVLVYHEAFGATPHIREVCHWLASNGFVALAPDLFEYPNLKAIVPPEAVKEVPPAAPMFSLHQNNAGFMAGRQLIMQLDKHSTAQLLQRTLAHARAEYAGLPIITMGYCWGGSLAYYAACLDAGIIATSCYYGGRLAEMVAEAQPNCPTEVIMATQDRYMHVPEVQAAFAKHHPNAAFYVYDADHGFNRTDGATYAPEHAKTARQNTLMFFNKVLAPLAEQA